MVHVCNSNAGETELGKLLELADQPDYSTWQVPGNWEILFPKSVWTAHEKQYPKFSSGLLKDTHLCMTETHTHTHKHTLTCTYICKLAHTHTLKIKKSRKKQRTITKEYSVFVNSINFPSQFYKYTYKEYIHMMLHDQCLPYCPLLSPSPSHQIPSSLVSLLLWMQGELWFG